MKKDDVLYIIIPAYNEESNIESVVNDWYPIIEQYNGSGKSKLVVINDGSKDNTKEILEDLAKTRKNLEVITKENSGHGGTVLYGYKYALKNNADYIFQTDSDGQTKPSEFHEFWDLKEEYDAIIGHRNKRQDGISRFFVTKVLKFVLRICFHEKIVDANTPFRLMSNKSLKECIKFIPEDFNLSNVILTIAYTKKKYKIKYIPITFKPRQGGVNSINLKKIFFIGKKALKDFREINKNFKKEGL